MMFRPLDGQAHSPGTARGGVAPGAIEIWASWFSNSGAPPSVILARPVITRELSSPIVFPPGLHGECDPGIALNMLQFLRDIQVSTDNFTTIKANPDKRDLRTAILVQSHKMSEMARSQCLPYGLTQNHHDQ